MNDNDYRQVRLQKIAWQLSYKYYIYYINNNRKQNKGSLMADYILKGVDDKLWREVKAAAALRGMTVKEFIIKLLEKEVHKFRK